jgi:hypothetical protein
MFGLKSRKTRKAAAVSVETVETYSRISTHLAGDPAKPHEVALERNGMPFGKASKHRTLWEAEEVARNLIRRFPDGYVAVSLAR